jgi:hypothetical protein
MEQKKNGRPGFNPMTTCILIQYTTTELTRIVLYWYLFTVLKTLKTHDMYS